MAQNSYNQQSPVCVPGQLFDAAADADGCVSFEAGTDLPCGRFVSLDANGKAVLANGSLPIIGVTVFESTKQLPLAAGSIVAILRKGRIFVEKAVGATAPALNAAASRHATDGTLVSSAGTVVPGAFGYVRGTTASNALPTNCALIELNLPSVTGA